tara:strand:- start:216 stop:830 length:615 start_codon:yes stop_codon:yes gene_type:complete
MASTTDIWAVTPVYSATLLRLAAVIGAGGDVPLLTNQPLDNGAGYKLSIHSVGNSSGITFTIVGYVVGDLTNTPTTEVLTGPTAGNTVETTNYYSLITSVTASAAATGNISIGTLVTDGVALPRCRLRGFYFIATAGAGSIALTLDGTAASDRTLLNVATPAIVQSQQMSLPGDGILIAGSAALSSFGVVVNTAAVTSISVFCS